MEQLFKSEQGREPRVRTVIKPGRWSSVTVDPRGTWQGRKTLKQSRRMQKRNLGAAGRTSDNDVDLLSSPQRSWYADII